MITHEMKDQSLWIHIVDSFTIDNFNEFQEAYKNLKANQVIIDLSKTTHIDSGGLGMLLQLRTQLGEDADKIVLHDASEHILKIFEVVNFQHLFTIS